MRAVAITRGIPLPSPALTIPSLRAAAVPHHSHCRRMPRASRRPTAVPNTRVVKPRASDTAARRVIGLTGRGSGHPGSRIRQSGTTPTVMRPGGPVRWCLESDLLVTEGRVTSFGARYPFWRQMPERIRVQYGRFPGNVGVQGVVSTWRGRASLEALLSRGPWQGFWSPHDHGRPGHVAPVDDMHADHWDVAGGCALTPVARPKSPEMVSCSQSFVSSQDAVRVTAPSRPSLAQASPAVECSNVAYQP